MLLGEVEKNTICQSSFESCLGWVKILIQDKHTQDIVENAFKSGFSLGFLHGEHNGIERAAVSMEEILNRAKKSTTPPG